MIWREMIFLIRNCEKYLRF